MKIEKEIVKVNPGQSFRLFRPRLRENFYWHYHPEYELVFVEAVMGLRHVGQHVSSYMESDLVMIGPNIPHLNFDYGLECEYRQIVVHLKPQFLGNAFAHTPEFEALEYLFQRASFGLAFYGETKARVVAMLQKISDLDYFQQLLTLLQIFQILAKSPDYEVLNEHETISKLLLNDKVRMGAVYDYIHKHYNETPDVNEVAAHVHLSTPAFCRYFKKQTRLTFTEFVNQYRVNLAKTLLIKDVTVSEACYAVGFGNLSHFSKIFRKYTGLNPTSFKKKYGRKNILKRVFEIISVAKLYVFLSVKAPEACRCFCLG